MPLVKAQCTNCGGALEVDTEKKAAICPYCHEAYVVEDAINNYITHIEHLHADNVTINDDRAAASRLEAAEASLKLKHWDEAANSFEEVCELTPQDYRGWWGMIRALTEEFSEKLITDYEFKRLNEYYEDALTFMNSDEKGETKSIFEPYMKSVKENRDYCQKTLEERIKDLEAEISNLSDKYVKLQSTSSRNENWWFESDLGCLGLIILGIILVFGIVQLYIGNVSEGLLFITILIIPFILGAISRRNAKSYNTKMSAKMDQVSSQRRSTESQLNTCKGALSYLRGDHFFASTRNYEVSLLNEIISKRTAK